MYDAIIVGAGHNGLVCANYLAKAGLKTLVIERRDKIGGAVITEDDIFPGYAIDTCSSFHIVIKALNIIEELQLEAYGLDYLQLDPFAFAPFPDGTSITFWRDVDKTCESIARLSSHDAEQYRKMITLWSKFNEPVYAIFQSPPAAGPMIRSIWRRERGQLRSMMGLGKSGDLLKLVFGSYMQFINHYFDDERVKAALGWIAAQSGTGPDDPGGGEMIAWHILSHVSGVWRPRGGSGMLSQALAKRYASFGGEIRVDAPVKSIRIVNKAVKGVELASGETIDARCVISNAHVQTTLLNLIEPGILADDLTRKIRNLRIANGMGMTVRCTADALPQYSAAPMIDGKPNIAHSGMQLLCPSTGNLRRAFHECALGQTPQTPAIIGMTPTVLDPSLAPDGKHIFNIWAQWHPFTLANGEQWTEDRSRLEAEKILRIVDTYAPNFSQHITGMYIKSPPDLERIGGLLHGHLMHLDMTLDQMFMFRPLPELANYETPIAGLWLTGASTHPGGGVSGAPGYNTAHAVLANWKRISASTR